MWGGNLIVIKDQELNRINEMIAFGMNRKKIAEKYKLLPCTFGYRFQAKYGMHFTKYKKKLIKSLKDGTYE